MNLGGGALSLSYKVVQPVRSFGEMKRIRRVRMLIGLPIVARRGRGDHISTLALDVDAEGLKLTAAHGPIIAPLEKQMAPTARRDVRMGGRAIAVLFEQC